MIDERLRARAYEAIPDESDADSAAIAAAREALETVRDPEKSWRTAEFGHG